MFAFYNALIYNKFGDILMRVLAVGDIVGRVGLEKLEKRLPELIKEKNIDFVIVNGENSANGKGLRNREYSRILAAGADVITMGNHLYYRKEMASEYEKLDRLLIPANITNLKGNGHVLVEKNNIKFGTINLIGKVGINEIPAEASKSPFETAKSEIEMLKNEGADYIFVDFHAEATAEKIALGYYLENDVNLVFGTHTHVPTADETVLGSGMAYITDVGMTGPKDSVLGLKKEVALERFVIGKYAKYQCSENEAMLNAIVVDFDDATKRATSIVRINEQ